MNVLIVFKNPAVDSPDACHQGLGVTALNIALSLREQRIDSDAFPVANGEYLWQKLAGEWSHYTHVVLSAPFIDPPFLRRLFSAFPQMQFALCYHSNLGFLSQDRFAGASLPAFMGVEASSHNFTMASNSPELSKAMRLATGRPFEWLPNLYHLPSQVRRSRSPWRVRTTLHVGLFGAARALKNWLTAGVAAMIMARALNSPVNLHVLVSEAIDWVPENWIAKADSAVDVAAKGAQLLRDKNAGSNGWKALYRYNDAAIKAWREWLHA